MDPDLVAAAAELGQDVRREHPGVAACDVDVQLRQAAQIVERIVEGDRPPLRIVGVRDPVGHLDLIDKEVTRPPLRRNGVPDEVQLYRDDLLRLDPLRQQMVPEERFEQIGFPTAADPRDDLHLSVPLIVDELPQILRSCDLHGDPPLPLNISAHMGASLQ